MRSNTLLILIFASFQLTSCAQEIPNKDAQIGGAVMAAPEELRDGAKVWGYDAKGEMVVLREGTNNQICLADNPNQEGFSVSCYHVDLEPFMARGRALKKEGKSRLDIDEIREAEAKSGALKMPEQATTLHVLSGQQGKYDFETNTVTDARLRYVVYIPFATAESSGLPTKPIVPGGPWIMDPGTHKAHIMITPPGN